MGQSAYQNVLAKYNWAKKHIDDFEVAFQSLQKAEPYAVGRNLNPDTGEFTFYIVKVPVIPAELCLIMGDAIHNLRSTLDHAAWAIVSAGGGRVDSHTGFPIFDTPEAYSSMSRSKVPGLRKMCYEYLDGLQSYRDGWSHTLWQIHKLDIVDKHRLLLTVASRKVGRTMTPSEEADLRTQAVDQIRRPRYGFVASTPTAVALKAGDILATISAADKDQDVSFAFDVSIDEPEVIVGVPIFIFLRFASSQILRVIQNLAQWM